MDDWMNPSSGAFYTPKPKPSGTYYLIQRKRRIPVSGNVSFLEEWDQWSEHATKAERDAELKRLRSSTDWHVRGRTIVVIGGRTISRDPFEYADD